MLSSNSNNKKTLIALSLLLAFLALSGCKKGGVNIVASITQPVISAGENNCEVNTAGRVLCWSDNKNGLEGRRVNQMDMEAVMVPSTPVPNEKPMANAVSVDIGDNLGCALLSNNNARAVACWKHGEENMLTPATDYWSSVPSKDYLANTVNSWTRPAYEGDKRPRIKQIAVGARHVCALFTDGVVECMGDNYTTQLSLSYPSVKLPNGPPLNVITSPGGAYIENVVAISAGGEHTCAIMKGNKVKCWGSNSYGQLGDGVIGGTDSAVDVQLLAEEKVKGISAGNNYTCALLTDNTVKCWGDNSKGQLGDGTMTNSAMPVDVVDLANVRSISAGNEHTCAILRDNTVKCWGANDKGQLGNLEKVDSLTPVEVLVEGINKNIRSISVGNKHSCALRSDNTVKCWGGDEPPATP